MVPGSNRWSHRQVHHVERASRSTQRRSWRHSESRNPSRGRRIRLTPNPVCTATETGSNIIVVDDTEEVNGRSRRPSYGQLLRDAPDSSILPTFHDMHASEVPNTEWKTWKDINWKGFATNCDPGTQNEAWEVNLDALTLPESLMAVFSENLHFIAWTLAKRTWRTQDYDSWERKKITHGKQSVDVLVLPNASDGRPGGTCSARGGNWKLRRKFVSLALLLRLCHRDPRCLNHLAEYGVKDVIFDILKAVDTTGRES